MSYMINNNALEVDPSPRKKRKRSLQCTNAYLNPALDILSTEDTMCNNIMEVHAPSKRTRRSNSCDSRASFENPALDLPKQAYNALLRKELANVNEKLTCIDEMPSPVYQNIYQSNNDSLAMNVEEKSLVSRHHLNQINSTPVPSCSSIVKRRASFDLSFIEKLGIDDSTNGEALYLDDDLNESNIMEIKTITTITRKRVKHLEKVAMKSTNPFLNCDDDYNAIEEDPIVPIVNFPFDVPVQNDKNDSVSITSSYEPACDMSGPEIESITSIEDVVPRRLFTEDDSSIQYIDEQSIIDDKKFGHSTFTDQINQEKINYNFASTSTRNQPVFVFDGMNKQSKILGCDVTNMSQNEIFNCEKTVHTNKVSIPNVNNNLEVTFKDNSHRADNNKKQITKSNNKISSKIFGKIKDVFKHDKKTVLKSEVAPCNPYEVVRKAPVQEKCKKPLPICFVNPALNLNTTDTDCEDENASSKYAASNYNTKNPFEITPLQRAKANNFYNKENLYSSQTSSLGNYVDLSDISYQTDVVEKKKHVRFDSTLNHEKVITGNSFDSDRHSVGSSNSGNGGPHQITQIFQNIDTEIDEYHNELENCFNEKKFISQNL